MRSSIKLKLLEHLKSLGFEGVHKSKAIINGKEYSLASVYKVLDLESELISSTDSDLNVAGFEIKKHKGHLSDLLRTMIYTEPEGTVPHFSFEEAPKIQGANEEKLLSGLRGNLIPFRSLRQSGMNFAANRVSGMEDPILIYDKTEKRILPRGLLSPTAMQLLGVTRDKIDRIPIVWPEFNPYSLELTYTGRIRELNIEAEILNTYSPPEWRKLKSKPKLHGIFKALIDNIFPLESEKEYVLTWLKQAIVGRNEVVMVLVGDRGVGKTMFSKVFFALVGNEYSRMAKREILTEKFNSELYMARAVAFEEVGLAPNSDTEGIDRMKTFCNDRLRIESKGQDSFEAQNYSSMLMSLNRNSKLGIKPQERRFSIPAIGHTNFGTVWDEAEINTFTNELDSTNRSKEFMKALSEFGEYILSLPDMKDIATPLRGDYYYENTFMSLPEWEAAIVTAAIKLGKIGEPMPIKTVSAPFKDSKPGFPKKESTITSFLTDYLHRNDLKIGTYKRKAGAKADEATIEFNKEFLLKYGAFYEEEREEKNRKERNQLL